MKENKVIIDWIRHTSLEVDGSVCYGQTDMKVSKNFESEAKDVKASIDGKSYDAVYTSPLSRASILAEYCGYPDAIRDKRVMELNFGDWEEMKWSELIKYENLEDWFANWHLKTPPNGEGLGDLLNRVRDFIHEMINGPHRHIAVFCHGGVINSARYMKGLLKREEIFMLVPPYGSVNTLEYEMDEEMPVIDLNKEEE